ncbi:MAG: cytochrome b/b6 domain-containing protein, partial [Thaumarchaeota archaeon]|nr:cytochrome b/b6 domain-containing protein [Nitrososphaerota archaeon]
MTHTTDPALVIGIAVFIAGFGLVHLVRRWGSMRTKVNLTAAISFTRAQRIMHWAVGFGCAALLVTGLPVYLAQFLVTPAVTTPFRFFYWGFQVSLWRTAHIYLALSVVLLVLVHSLWDTYRVKAAEKIVRVSRADFGEAWRRVRSFLGFSREGLIQPTRKYDFFHKAFHWTLIALGAFLLISGLVEWEAIQIQGVPVFVLLDRFNHAFMDGFLRTGHLVAAMLFAGMFSLHVYFSVLPQN